MTRQLNLPVLRLHHGPQQSALGPGAVSDALIPIGREGGHAPVTPSGFRGCLSCRCMRLAASNSGPHDLVGWKACHLESLGTQRSCVLAIRPLFGGAMNSFSTALVPDPKCLQALQVTASICHATGQHDMPCFHAACRRLTYVAVGIMVLGHEALGCCCNPLAFSGIARDCHKLT